MSSACMPLENKTANNSGTNLEGSICVLSVSELVSTKLALARGGLYTGLRWRQQHRCVFCPFAVRQSPGDHSVYQQSFNTDCLPTGRTKEQLAAENWILYKLLWNCSAMMGSSLRTGECVVISPHADIQVQPCYLTHLSLNCHFHFHFVFAEKTALPVPFLCDRK